jgi:hypothetical protein
LAQLLRQIRLNIVSVDPNNGEIVGTLNFIGQAMHQIRGLYAAISGNITFMGIIDPATPPLRIFTGYFNGSPTALAGYL